MDGVIPEVILKEKKSRRASKPKSSYPQGGNNITMFVGESLDFTEKVRYPYYLILSDFFIKCHNFKTESIEWTKMKIQLLTYENNDSTYEIKNSLPPTELVALIVLGWWD